MKIAYTPREFNARHMSIIAQADIIASDLAARGYTLTLRQLYYQFVHRNLFENVERNYDLLGRLVNDGRLAGFIDWDHIVDRTRESDSVPHWTDPQDIMEQVAESFRMDKWEGQTYRPEAWVEKEALIDVISRPAKEWDLTWFACRGYASASSQHEAAKRFIRAIRAGQKPVIIHLGDHDPSGIDMSRDIYDRINLFVNYRTGEDVEVRRIALNMDQIEQYQPPPNPAKSTDSRFREYRRVYGTESWELDALDPPVIEALITAEVESMLDRGPWDEHVETETEHRRLLKEASDRWDEVVETLDKEA